LIRCRVSNEVRGLLKTVAAQRQITESALVRQLIEATVQMATVSVVADCDAPTSVVRDAWLYVRLAPEDRLLLSDRAKARGMPSATYVSVLVRSHLRALAPLPKEELMALKRSVAELGGIGRNLNQIVRLANQGSKPAGPGREDLRAMLRVAEGLRDHVKGLLKANQISGSRDMPRRLIDSGGGRPLLDVASYARRGPGRCFLQRPRPGAVSRRVGRTARKQSFVTC